MTLTATVDGQDFTIEGDWVADIHEMHTKFGVNRVVQNLTPEQLKQYLEFRIKMLAEELKETQDAFAEKDADGVVDGIIDLCVFAIGTLDAFNVDSYEAWARVRDANMAKEPGVKEGRPNPFGFPDLIKPEGWTAPTHVDNVGLIGEALK